MCHLELTIHINLSYMFLLTFWKSIIVSQLIVRKLQQHCLHITRTKKWVYILHRICHDYWEKVESIKQRSSRHATNLFIHAFFQLKLHIFGNSTQRQLSVTTFVNRIHGASSPPWASYQIRKIAGCACAGNAGNVFPATNLKWKR